MQEEHALEITCTWSIAHSFAVLWTYELTQAWPRQDKHMHALKPQACQILKNALPNRYQPPRTVDACAQADVLAHEHKLVNLKLGRPNMPSSCKALPNFLCTSRQPLQQVQSPHYADEFLDYSCHFP